MPSPEHNDNGQSPEKIALRPAAKTPEFAYKPLQTATLGVSSEPPSVSALKRALQFDEKKLHSPLLKEREGC